MVPDTVRGLARRHGSVTRTETKLPHTYDTLVQNTAGHRNFRFSSDEVDYDLLYRSGLRHVETAEDDTFFCRSFYSDQFIPVVVHDTVATQALRVGGVSAITQVGKFVIMAGNTYKTTWEATPLWDTPENQSRMAVWVRGGAYSRTFKMTLTSKINDEQLSFTYDTPPSSYPNLLDTSDILTSDPDYTKKVNDRVYDYNSRVTAHIGEAAAAITPNAIAQALLAEYVAAGYPGGVVEGSTVYIDDDRWSEVSVDDDGDGSLMVGVGNIVESASDVGPVHHVGKVVKVRPSKESPETAFYLRAYAKDDYSTGLTEVTWREGAAVEYTADRLFVLGTVYGGVMYVSDEIEWLEDRVDSSTADDIPTYSVSMVGDDISSPLPNFLGRSIDYLGTMQDRLVVGSGPVINMSKSGDYFNFWRSTVLAIPSDDPIEMFALGSEDDTIRFATPFNRDLILYGEKGQYSINGSQPLTPGNAALVTLSKFDTNIDASPVASGNLAFYATKRGNFGDRTTTVRQIQPANLSEDPESQEISEQLDGYIKGTAVEIAAMTNPSVLLVRTDAARNSLYLYNYLDRGNGERVQGAWHRWEWDEIVGNLIGISPSSDGFFLAYVIRKDVNDEAWLSCERFSMAGDLSPYPYLDALRVQSVPGCLDQQDATKLAVAFGSGDRAFEGSFVSNLLGNEDYTGAFLGVSYDAGVTPTNPFPKDQAGKNITFGRMTLGTVKVSTSQTGGIKIYSTLRNGAESQLLKNNSGFYVGLPEGALGKQPVQARTFTAYIGGEVRECSYTIASNRWLPITITQIEWAGQLFNRNRR
jgi:hypothetical protein